MVSNLDLELKAPVNRPDKTNEETSVSCEVRLMFNLSGMAGLNFTRCNFHTFKLEYR